MLYAFFGTDVIKVRTEAHAFIKKAKPEEGELIAITPENYAPGMIEDAAGGVSLFGRAQLFVIDTPSEHEELFEQVFSMLEVLQESNNVFVLIEGKLLAPEKKKLERHAEKHIECAGAPAERFNSFSLADALLSRDKKRLWVLLAQARENGLSAEELAGTLFWQLKALRLAEISESAETAGLKPFVYQKAKRALLKFKAGELAALSEKLVALYHDGHAGERDIDVALERWVLAL